MNRHVHALRQRARDARIRQAGWLLLPLACAAIIAIRPFGHWALAFFALSLLLVALWLVLLTIFPILKAREYRQKRTAAPGGTKDAGN